MKAQVIEDYCFTPDFKLVELEKPSQLNNKQLLVKIKVVGLNRGDSLIRRGDAKLVFKFKMPCIMGLEGAGTVEAVGAGVTKFKIGDDVIVFLKNDRLGTTAEYTVCAEDELVLKPNNMDFKQAAGVPTVTCTALEMFRSYSPINDVIKREIEHCKVHGKLTDAYEENDRQNVDILVIGASGGVGMAAIILAKGFLSRYFNIKVYGVCSGKNVQVVKSLGADVVIDYTQTTAKDGADNYHPKSSTTPSICQMVKENGGKRIDLVLNCVPGYYFYDDVVQNLCSSSPQVVYTSAAPQGPCKVTYWTLVQFGSFIISAKTKSFFSGYPAYYFARLVVNAEDLEFVANYALEKNWMPITEFDFADINKAHEILDSERAVGKLVLIL